MARPLTSLVLALAQGASPAPREGWTWNDFPVFVWRERYRGSPLPDELAAPFGGVILMREEPSDWARERGLAYLVWNVAGRDALHLDADEAWRAKVERWIETRDEALLVREPCLNDPATLEKLEETLTRTLALHGKHPGLGFVLGDEVSLTPNGDPFDLCRCEHCEEHWTEYAKQHALPERAPLTDEVRLALLEDDDSLLGAWLARRRFDQDRMIAVLKDMAERARGPDDEPAIGVLGLSGRTAFGGIDMSRVTECFDFFECYPVGEGRELLYSLRGIPPLLADCGPLRGKASLTTIFVDQETPVGAAWLAWEHWIRGGNGLVLWSDAALEEGVDRSERLAAAIQTIRGLASEFGPSRDFVNRWMNLDPVVIVTDADSAALSWLRDSLLDGPTWPRRFASYQRKHGTRERKVESWVRLIEDAGFLPQALPVESIGPKTVAPNSVLILPELGVLGDEDADRLLWARSWGCAFVVDGALGTFDRDGRPRDRSVLERLDEAAPSMVLEPPYGLDGYLSVRGDPRSSATLRSFLIRVLGTAGAGPFPRIALGPQAESVPWLCGTWPQWVRFCAMGSLAPPTVVAMLPNLVTSDERREHLRDLRLEPSAPEGFELQWIHPREGGILPAGDAAVFLLRRIDDPLDDPLPEPR